MATPFEAQVKVLFLSLTIPHDWRKRMSRLAAGDNVASLDQLLDRRRRLVRAFGDDRTAYDEDEYARRLETLNAQIRAAQRADIPDYEAAMRLFSDLAYLWEAATSSERKRLIAPLVERVYIDLDTTRIAAIVPTPTFRGLLEGALENADRADVRLLAQEDVGPMYGLVEIGGLEPPTSAMRTQRSPN